MTVDLAFQVVGDGPPLLVLHGLFGSGSNWRGVARALSPTHQVLSVDLRNHGASPWASTMGYADMAGDVLALMDREGLSSAAVLGHPWAARSQWHWRSCIRPVSNGCASWTSHRWPMRTASRHSPKRCAASTWWLRPAAPRSSTGWHWRYPMRVSCPS